MTKRTFAALLATAVFFVGACGDDDTTSTGSPSAPADDVDTGGDEADGDEQAGGEFAEFCTAYSELLAGEPGPEAIREVAAVAPEEGKEPLETIAAGFEEQGEGFFESEEFGQAFAEIGGVANDACADETFEVTAMDYGFDGIPAELSAGTYGVDFSNEGDEFHEMVVFRKGDDTTESFEEIFAMEEDAAMALVAEIGGTFAPPGQSAGGLFDMSEPGEYVAVCFIPVGSTPEAGEEVDGPPHLTQGMISEFTVS